MFRSYLDRWTLAEEHNVSILLATDLLALSLFSEVSVFRNSRII